MPIQPILKLAAIEAIINEFSYEFLTPHDHHTEPVGFPISKKLAEFAKKVMNQWSKDGYDICYFSPDYSGKYIRVCIYKPGSEHTKTLTYHIEERGDLVWVHYVSEENAKIYNQYDPGLDI